MLVVRGVRNLHEKPERPVVTLGNFDGLHLGHQEIIRLVTTRAEEAKGVSCVYTFDPHPLKILAPNQSVNLLTTFKKKMELIASFGVDITICADFNINFARMHPGEFVKKLANGLGMEKVIVGHDYSFGKGKKGDIGVLEKLGKQYGFAVEVAPPVIAAGIRVSSSAIREALYDGDVSKAERLLGRLYSIAGHVVTGYQRGAAIGFPTANLDTPYEVIPAVGVYAVFIRCSKSKWHDGVVNVGYNPTFDRDDLIVEAHLLDTDRNIYGEEIEVFFVERLRDEVKFGSVEELKNQIGEDIKSAKKVLANATRPNAPGAGDMS